VSKNDRVFIEIKIQRNPVNSPGHLAEFNRGYESRRDFVLQPRVGVFSAKPWGEKNQIRNLKRVVSVLHIA
jgi:hypothetical protein